MVHKHRKALAVAGLALALTACGKGGSVSAPAMMDPTTGTPSAPATATPTAQTPQAFKAEVTPIRREQVKHSWRPGCPVPFTQLRMITMTYWGFDGQPHTGHLVVNAAVTQDVIKVFNKLYDMRFPIKRMEPVDTYRGSDFDSIEADNTSAFNCRKATGSSNWSNHSLGTAIDLNPQENPYVYSGGRVAHANARQFSTRPLDKPGVVNPGDRVVKAFESIGWGWGGYWSGIKDYQHFSSSGD
ncbi:M15 family metallopeptidase [Rhizohabitans arisaemae]|uniref:M15 family metallopeptidase n=1 Tax=Rhizohabitans arisaemae TaxID=2720610 RepID=UPI0031FE5F2E